MSIYNLSSEDVYTLFNDEGKKVVLKINQPDDFYYIDTKSITIKDGIFLGSEYNYVKFSHEDDFGENHEITIDVDNILEIYKMQVK